MDTREVRNCEKLTQSFKQRGRKQMCCFHLLVFNSLTKLWPDYLSLYCLICKLNHTVLPFKRYDFGRTFGKISVSPVYILWLKLYPCSPFFGLVEHIHGYIYFLAFYEGGIGIVHFGRNGSERNNKMQKGIKRISTNSNARDKASWKGTFTLWLTVTMVKKSRSA